MKKTILLIVALIIGATSANAQRFISLDPQNVQKAVKQEAQIDRIVKKQAVNPSKDFVYGPAVMTVSFDDDTQYEFVNLPGHTAGNLQGKFARLDTSAASTTIIQGTYPRLYTWFAMATRGYYWFNELLGGEVGDGYALVVPYSVWEAEGDLNTKAYNTAIKFTEPIVTTGFNTVDVVFKQYTSRFNSDRYFVDYSTDPNFNVYDSIEFNARGLDLDVNEETDGSKRITLPVAQSIDKPALYIRLRYTCPLPEGGTSGQPAGYWWLVDEVNVYDGPAQRLDLIKTHHYYAAFGVIPAGMPMDTMKFGAIIENTGGNTLYDAVAEEKYHTATDMVFPNVFDNYTGYSAVSATPTNITTNTYLDTLRDANEVIIGYDIRRHIEVEAQNKIYYTETPGLYGLSTGIRYKETPDATDYSEYPFEDSIYYRVSEMPEATSDGFAKWATDIDILTAGQAWAYGYVSVGGVRYYTSNAPGAKVGGYEVCNRFITPADLPANTYYAKGVEIVPAADSCDLGIRVQATLKYVDFQADDLENMVKVVKDANNHDVISHEVLTYAENTNNGTLEPRQSTTNYNSMILGFTESGITLQPDQWYYACYKLLDDGRFYIAKDDKDGAFPTFKLFDWWTKFVSTPGEESGLPTWGERFGDFLSDYNSPMIRLLVSKNPAALASINSVENTSSFNFTAYPNPAQNETTIEYTLNNKGGNVVITVTDIMGREVVRMDQGKKAANSSSRITLNTQNLNNGTYFYTLSVNGEKETKKLVIRK